MVGGGPAGSAVANRLSEDTNINVLLIEAGPAGRDEPSIQVPGMCGDAIGSIYDWNISTVSQAHLDNSPRFLPKGHGLGGGSIINGLLWSRGSAMDYADCVALGNEGWAWSDLLPYFMKSETYSPIPSVELAVQFSIEEDPTVHGSSGPVSVSFPHYIWNESAVLFSALNELGVPTAYDPNNGRIAGASFLPLNIDPNTQSRSTARTAYLDSAITRPNLWVNTGQYVTQVLFADASINPNAASSTVDPTTSGEGSSPGTPGSIYGGGTIPMGMSLWASIKRTIMPRQTAAEPTATGATTLTAVGVEYAADSQSIRQTISATREVIIAAGALHSPQLLLLSGVGPASTLEVLEIPVNIDSSGVGSNLQDHRTAPFTSHDTAQGVR